MKNNRAEAMWKIIEPRVQFKDQRVLDLGCGYGDFSFAAARNHASSVVAVDKDMRILEDAAVYEIYHDIVFPVQTNINNLIQDNSYTKHFDIAMCFSVLPYLNSPAVVLQWLSLIPIVLLEVQYNGDGPGFDFLNNDQDFIVWARGAVPAWDPLSLGKTYPPGRPHGRTIWLCQK